jgi:hypothetical protein
VCRQAKLLFPPTIEMGQLPLGSNRPGNPWKPAACGVAGLSNRDRGGSAQKFCSTGHRQEFWIAARRWTMRAIEAGLLSVDCLKASHTSVHAA